MAGIRVSGIPAIGEPVPVTGESGSLYIQSDPAGAEVMVNGSSVGNTPLLYLSGRNIHIPLEIICKKDGYGTELFRLKTMPKTGTVQYISFSLTPLADYGRILVTADPSGSQVRLDGGEPLPVPVVFDHVSGGVHEVRIAKPGYKEYINPDVRVNPGNEVNIAVLLLSNQKKDVLVITTEPVGADIFVDGLFRGQTRKEASLVIGSLTSGNHDIRTHLSGYQDETETVAIIQDQSTNVHFFLTKVGAVPQKTVFLIRTDPYGSDVLVNGIWMGKTPVGGYLELDEIPSNQVNLTLYLQGYQNYSEWILPQEGETVIIDRKMQKESISTSSH
ncbi:MAG: PEGA domain-containing protein [Methanospirillum sp.]|nr:PEGA domain-containing protein [Methanospirillum sp.]